MTGKSGSNRPSRSQFSRHKRPGKTASHHWSSRRSQNAIRPKKIKRQLEKRNMSSEQSIKNQIQAYYHAIDPNAEKVLNVPVIRGYQTVEGRRIAILKGFETDDRGEIKAIVASSLAEGNANPKHPQKHNIIKKGFKRRKHPSLRGVVNDAKFASKYAKTMDHLIRCEASHDEQVISSIERALENRKKTP